MTPPSLPELLESLRAVCLDLVTYNKESRLNEASFRDLRKTILSHFGADAFPACLSPYRHAGEVRAVSQDLGGYKERRAWINGCFNEKLDQVEGGITHTTSSTSSSITAPLPATMASSQVVPFPATFHPALVARCEKPFDDGQYDTCVLNAFRYIEVRIRELGGFAEADIGVALVSKAMSKNNPVIVLSTHEAEQEGFHALFRGAIASFKNPASHKEVGHDNPARVMEMLAFASLLLHLLDGATINRTP